MSAHDAPAADARHDHDASALSSSTAGVDAERVAEDGRQTAAYASMRLTMSRLS